MPLLFVKVYPNQPFFWNLFSFILGSHYYSLASNALVLHSLSLLCLMKNTDYFYPHMSFWNCSFHYCLVIFFTCDHISAVAKTWEFLCGSPELSSCVAFLSLILRSTNSSHLSLTKVSTSSKLYFSTLFPYWILDTSFKQLYGLTSFVPFSLESVQSCLLYNIWKLLFHMYCSVF